MGHLVADCPDKKKSFEDEKIMVIKDNNEDMIMKNEEIMENVKEKFIPRRGNYENDFEYAINEILSIEYLTPTENDMLKIGNTIDCMNYKKLISLFNDFYVNPIRPNEPAKKCEMKLFIENPKAFHHSPRRLSYTEKDQLQVLLDEYLDQKIIRPSSSEYASAIVLVKKKTGDLRMCVDFRTLNKMTAKDNYPLPMIDDLLDKLANKNYFTKLDLKNGYFHVFVHEDSIKFTSFVTPLGQFEWLRMPFGLKNAPSVFQRYINSIFADMIRQNQLIIYMDDILIATSTLDEHFKLLKEVFTRLVENKLELRLDKCKFLQEKIEYLGYSVDKNGISPDNKGIAAITNFPLPQNSHEVQRFVGLGSYFRRFIQNFSVLAKPLYDLLKKDKKFVFGEKELISFESIKKKLSEFPILAIYDPRDETELHCDASSIGFGSILLQKKSDGKWHPIFYFSKRTTDTESRYHSFELETLAIIYALKRFRVYLYGKTFKIVTDCNSLALTLNKKELNPRIARWALELQNFEYILEHRANSRMQHVDALSRSNNIMIVESP